MISLNFQIAINKFKQLLEEAITSGCNDGKNCGNGLKAKESLIRSSKLINLIHEAVKKDLIDNGVQLHRIFPPHNASKPELKIAGFLKQKNQDVCVVPTTIKKQSRIIDWGPLATEGLTDHYGQAFCEASLVINVRSQVSSLAKNADTLFERTFAEPMNLHLIYPNMVLGDVYLIPVYEYDEALMLKNKVGFKSSKTNVLKYISFFSAISNRQSADDDLHKYERCALLVVDFCRTVPKIYTTTTELIADGIIPASCSIDFEKISIDNFTQDIIQSYNNRFKKNILNI
ncbi:MAG: hypothetical protein K2N64_08070 [Anaeroplasmataceae bacterium]|nr:hypothetical protein [Anaeroplasmataceae bacterium]